MSNLRSDAREFAETLPPGDKARVFILRLCSQVDEVEFRWHERAQQAAGMADEIVHLQNVLRDQDRVNEWRTEQSLNSLLREALASDADESSFHMRHNCYLDGLMLTETQKQAIRNVYAREESGTLRSDLWGTPQAEAAEYEVVAGLWRAYTGDQVSTDQDSAIAWLGHLFQIRLRSGGTRR